RTVETYGSLQDGEHWEGCAAGEDRRDAVNLRAHAIGDPLAVALDDLAGSLLVDRLRAMPGRHGLRDDVVTIDDGEAVAGKERWPVGEELLAAVVEDCPERAVVCSRRVCVQGE